LAGVPDAVAFQYYLPAWLNHALNYMNGGYPAQFVLGYLHRLDPEYQQQFSKDQLHVMRRVYEYLRRLFPEEAIPATPAFIHPACVEHVNLWTS